MYMVFLSFIMAQNRPEFSNNWSMSEHKTIQEEARLLRRNSANPFADQGAHCRPWTQASLFSCSKYKRACEVVDKAVMGDTICEEI
jgi:hypothetical protein